MASLRRRWWLLGGFAVAVALGAPAGVLGPEIASAHHIILKRDYETIRGVKLRTRGYLHERCVLTWSPCESRGTGTFKPEASVRARFSRRWLPVIRIHRDS